jgi:hypothetical protein
MVEPPPPGGVSTVRGGGGAGAAALVALFILRETRTPHPLIPLRIFRSRNVAGANIARALQLTGIYGSFFLLSLYLQRQQHYSALDTGLAFVPQSLLIGVFSLGVTARLVNRIGAKRTLLPGFVLLIAGLLLYARLPLHSSYVRDLLPGLLLIGFGAALTFLPLISLAMAGVPAADYGAASGMTSVSQQVGGAVGLALLATLSASHARQLASSGHIQASALLAGDHLAFLVAAGTVAAALAVSAVVMRTPTRAESAGAAESAGGGGAPDRDVDPLTVS